MLAIRDGDQLEVFEDSHFMDVHWNVAECDASLRESEFSLERPAGRAGQIDITDAGHVEMTSFVDELHRQLSFVTDEPGWTLPMLANWIDREIPHPDIPQTFSSLFIHKALEALCENRGIALDQLARQKFPLARAIEAKIDSHRREQRKRSYNMMLFGTEAASIEVSLECCLTYDENRYPPSRYYEGGYRFGKHLYTLPGELRFDGEEFECAVFLDQLTDVEVWVRNLERMPESAFWLQTSTDRFYPDFVARLTDGRILVVEYKGVHLWSNDDSKEKRAFGKLWADRSSGTCIFVMPNGTDSNAITSVIGSSE